VFKIERITSGNLYDLLKQLEPFSLSFHHDADGVYSASIIMSIFKVTEVQCPPFNEYTTDVAVDLGYPFDQNYSGIVVDHHPDHPKDRKYKLFWDHVPTGVILYNELKDHLKKEDIWKVVGSATGDGQPEVVPDEIWESYPILLEERGVLGRGQYKVYTSAFPLFYFLSSGVNALCRLGFPLQALDIVNNAKSPLEVLDHQEVRDAVDQIRSEEDSIYRSKPLVETIKNRYIIIRFRTSSPAIRMSGFLASKISSNNPGKTIIAINEENGQVSLRGVLAKYVANKLSEKGFKAGGHPGYCGANVSPEEIDKFIDVIRGL